MVRIIRDSIVEKIENAVEQARRAGVLRLDTLPPISVEHTSSPQHGDFATSLPLRLARATRISPMKIAEELVTLVNQGEEVEEVWAAAPGFINFRLRGEWLVEQVEDILETGQKYGTLEVGAGRKVIVEYVSVNPTGPVHVGHIRGAVLGSTLARLLETAGYAVTREYYVNDAGSQMEAFYHSIYARYKQAMGQEVELPPGGYMGSYVTDLTREIVAREGDRFLSMSEEDALGELGRIGRERMIQLIEEDLRYIRVEFDNWFSEETLYGGGGYDEAMNMLSQGNYIIEREGAQWFTYTALGEDKDNVLVRSTGVPTYFASDIAYHYNKFVQRGYDQAINIWGADHQGHVPRMKAALAALGIEPKRLTVMVSQMVGLKRGQEVVRASKRAGEFITLRELVDEVGVDACRYFFLARTPESQMEFDLELAKKESKENPVYYVQYGHARMAGILNNAREKNINWTQGEVSLLKDPSELALIRKMVLLPELVESAARTLEPHHLPHYALELATAFHWFYENCRVLSSDPADYPLTLARLKLVEAAQIVLFRTLYLMDLEAPERMYTNLVEVEMVASQQERQQVEAVIREWMSSFAAMDVKRLKALWDQEYPQLIYIPEESDDAMTDWAAISKYYDALPDMVVSSEWSMDNLMVDVIGDAAYAYCTMFVKANVKGIDNTLVAHARDTFVLRKTGGQWKLIHYHESLSRDRSHEMWSFLWS